MKLTKNQKKEISKMAKKYGLKLVLLFGSFSSGKIHEGSDYDIAVLTEESKNISNLKNYNNILFFLSEVLEIPSQKIDLTNLNNANPLLCYEITMKGKLVFADRNLFDEHRARSFRNYIDSQPLFNLEHHLIEKRNQMLKQLILKQ